MPTSGSGNAGALVTPSGTAGYAGIYAWVRAELQKTSVQLPDADATMVLQTAGMVDFMLRAAPCIGTYADLSAAGKEADRALFDHAAGIFVAEAMLSAVLRMANGGAGAVKREKIGPDETEYSGPIPLNFKDAAGMPDELLASANPALFAARLFNRISCVAAANVARSTSPGLILFGVAGRTRAQEAQNPYLLRGNLYDQLLDAGLIYNWWQRK